MKKFLMFLSVMFALSARADTETINWYKDGQTYAQTTCTVGGDIILPATPTKRGYNFTGWEQVFTKLEYIQGTGTQYIDTGFIPNQDTRVKLKVVMDVIDNDYNVICGSGQSYNSRAFELGLWQGNLFSNYGNYSNSIRSVKANDILVIDKNKNVISYSINYAEYEASQTYGTFTSPYQMRIFAETRPENVLRPATGAKMKLYYFQIYDDGVLVHDFIPALDPDDTPCLYDKVEDKFYYNPGTDDFIAGPVI